MMVYLGGEGVECRSEKTVLAEVRNVEFIRSCLVKGEKRVKDN